MVIPCIHNTIPGTVPENWRIQLEFVLSDTPLNLTPVYIAPERVTPTQPGQTDESDLPGSQARLLVSHSLVEGDNLILAGFIRGLGQEYRNQVGSLEVLDANGQPVPWVYSYEPSGIANAYANEIGFWMIRIKPAGLAFPLEIRRSYEERSQPLPDEKTSITIHFRKRSQISISRSSKASSWLAKPWNSFSSGSSLPSLAVTTMTFTSKRTRLSTRFRSKLPGPTYLL